MPTVRAPGQGGDGSVRHRAPQALPLQAVHGQLPVVPHQRQQVHGGAPAAQHHLGPRVEAYGFRRGGVGHVWGEEGAG